MRKSETYDRCVYEMEKRFTAPGSICQHSGVVLSSSEGEAGQISRAWGITFNNPDLLLWGVGSVGKTSWRDYEEMKTLSDKMLATERQETNDYCVIIGEDPFRVVVWYDEAHRFHRENGPAFISYEIISWYRNGLRHREDGPAVVFSDGSSVAYFLNNECLSESKWKERVASLSPTMH